MENKTVKDTYNAIAGTSAGRLAALSEGVFAVAMTLLVLDIRVPATGTIHGELDLWRAVVALSPRLIMYVMSFMTPGIFWVGQQTQLDHLAQTNRSLTWIHLGFLFAVSITPFSTTLLAQFTAYRSALLIYWVNILVLGAFLYFSWVCALDSGVVKANMPSSVSGAIKRRILVAQALYAFGALLCAVSTRWSIAFIVIVQLNYALAPHLPRHGRQRPGKVQD
jgi:uncharacterized membrane protein